MRDRQVFVVPIHYGFDLTVVPNLQVEIRDLPKCLGTTLILGVYILRYKHTRKKKLFFFFINEMNV